MSGGLKWSEEQLADYERRTGLGRGRPLSAHDVSAPAGERPSSTKAARARRNPSALETELGGNFAVMQLKPEAQFRFHPERKWRFDFAFPDELVAVELDGGIFAAENGQVAGKHARGAGRLKDYEKRNAAAELGWFVLCYGPPQVRSGEAALQVERLVRSRRLLLAGGAVK
jgi:very-short-patch-repair endonuclease